MSLIIEAFTRIAPLSQEQIENVIQITKEQKKTLCPIQPFGPYAAFGRTQ